jgi:hypothetical protein
VNNPNETQQASIEKAVATFMKNATGLYEADLQLFSTALDAFKKSNPGKGINDFVDTDSGMGLRDRVEKSRLQLMRGPVEALTKGLDDDFAAIGQTIAKQVEEFSVQHNYDPVTARNRLEVISPTFAALVKRQVTISETRREEVTKSAAIGDRWRQNEMKSREAEARASVEKANEEARAKGQKPAERALMDLAKSRALTKGTTVGAEINSLVETEEGRALYAAAQGERA